MIAWDQAPQWGEKGKKRGQIGEIWANEASRERGSGRGKGRLSVETCLWCRRSMIPDSGIMLWLVKCLYVDKFEVLLRVSRSFNITLLYISEKIYFKTRISSKQYKVIFARLLAYPSASRKAKTMAVICYKKKKKHPKYWAFLIPFHVINYGQIYEAIDL